MLILASTHRRVLAEGQGRARITIDSLTRELAAEREVRIDWEGIASRRQTEIRNLRRQLAETQSKLDRFTGPRPRDAKGHFIKGAK